MDDIEKFKEEKKNPNERTFEKMKLINYKSVYDKEYGIYHFRVPNPLLRKASFDCSGEQTFWAKSISHEYTVFYKPISAPGKDDWLMNHKEYGQTFLEYKNFGFHQIKKNKDIIYIASLSFNINPSFDQNFITSMIVLCQSYFYDMKIKLLNLKINLEGVEYRNYEDGSYQLNACTIIEKLYYEMPDDGYCLICLTDIDLYNDVRVIKPRKWIYYPPPYKNDFCYELNSYKYWVSICSIARFDPSFGLDEKPKDDNIKIKFYFNLLKRCAKVVVKNIAHMFGLRNCIFFKCVMNGFNSMKEFDSRPIEVCPCCLRKIFTNISRKYYRLDDDGRVKNAMIILDRFKNLRDNLKDNFAGIFERELEWYNDRIDSLNKELFGEEKEEKDF
jgi:archaemetzincin